MSCISCPIDNVTEEEQENPSLINETDLESDITKCECEEGQDLYHTKSNYFCYSEDEISPPSRSLRVLSNGNSAECNNGVFNENEECVCLQNYILIGGDTCILNSTNLPDNIRSDSGEYHMGKIKTLEILLFLIKWVL